MDSINLINQIAPEHLELSVDKPNAFLKKIKNVVRLPKNAHVEGGDVLQSSFSSLRSSTR